MRILTPPRHKIVVRAVFDRLTIPYHDYSVGVAHGGEAMGDDNSRLAGTQMLQRLD
jgi:hypothetical protein